jgi:hypothetical protein
MHQIDFLAQESLANSSAAGGVLIALVAAIIYGVVDFVRFEVAHRRRAKLRRPTFAEVEARYGIESGSGPSKPRDESPIEKGNS